MGHFYTKTSLKLVAELSGLGNASPLYYILKMEHHQLYPKGIVSLPRSVIPREVESPCIKSAR